MSTDRNIVINSENFSNSITKFDETIKKVEESLKNISNYMSNIDGTNENWRSETALSVHEKFSNLEKNFENINTELNVYKVFLQETLDNYNEEEIKQEQAIEKYDSDLNIN